MFEGYSASLQLYRLPAKVCDEKLTRTDVDIHQAGKMWCKDKIELCQSMVIFLNEILVQLQI